MKWVRPVLALLAMSGLTLGFFLGKVAVEAYVPFAAGMVAWWFNERSKDKERSK